MKIYKCCMCHKKSGDMYVDISIGKKNGIDICLSCIKQIKEVINTRMITVVIKTLNVGKE